MTLVPGDPQPNSPDVIAIRQTVRVDLPPDEAFRLFTDGINEWWPLDEGYAYGGDRAHQIFLEPTVGGRFFERFVDGDELQVGTVVACTPPHMILLTWHGPDWQAATEVEVRFLPDASGTTVELEHRGFEKLGPDGQAIAQRWAGGWPRVIQAFGTRAVKK
jgi:uncharacterized protein YndB with AHSA1/START domain